MATKTSLAAGKKRKATAAMSTKSSSKQTSKKLRLDQPKSILKRREPENVPSESEGDEDDSDDGGVALDAKEGLLTQDSNGSSKGKTGGDGDASKTVERSSGETSKESHAKQKQLALERKASKPLADELARTKKLWERLRIKSKIPLEERRKLVDELFTIITGRTKDFVLKHDAVRAVQTAIKYGNLEQRRQIARELKGSYAQLAENRYAKFLIGKLMVQEDNEIRGMIVPEFYGKVKRLINHPEASWILDDIYRAVATLEQKAMILREWYGPEFSILALQNNEPAEAHLSQILANEPQRRAPIMKHLMDMINALVQKRMTGFTSLHDAMLQYFLNVQRDTTEFNEFFELFRGDETADLLKNMAFTKSGSKLACLLLAHGTAKDRKQLLKAFKGTFALMSGDQYAHMVIITTYDVVDDTKLTGKAIFPELLGESQAEIVKNVIGAAGNINARITLLYLLEGASGALFPLSHRADLDLLKEVHEIRNITSKKDEDIRRKELIAAISPHLITAVVGDAPSLVSSQFGCQFITDVMLDAIGDKTKALEGVAATAAGDPSRTPDSPVEQTAMNRHISQTLWGGRMLKAMVAGGKFDKATGRIKPVEPPLNFGNILYAHIKDDVVGWATGPSSFVVLNMLESEGFDHKDELKKKLRKNAEVLKRSSTQETEEQKAMREARETKDASDAVPKGKNSRKNRKGKEGDSAGHEVRVGNIGSRLLLDKL